MKIACIVLASGKGLRFDKTKSKLFYKVYRIPIIEYTLKKIINKINKDHIYITISKKLTKKDEKIISNYTSNELIYGGITRLESVKKAVNKIKADNYDYIVIHDGARPLTSDRILRDLLFFIESKRYDGVVTRMQVEDTLRKNNITVNRSEYSFFQTPQAFKFKLYCNNIKKINNLVTDDLGIIEKKRNLKIKYISGNKENIKITKFEDIEYFKKFISRKIKYANGFDIHRLKKGNYLILAGLKIRSQFMSIGFSDGDVVLHAIMDSLLGIVAKGDIGKYFPPTNEYKKISSIVLFKKIKEIIKFENIVIDNLDCTIICQKIRLEKYKHMIKKNIAQILECKKSCINVKAKTSDHIGLIGKSKAIACWVTVKCIKL